MKSEELSEIVERTYFDNARIFGRDVLPKEILFNATIVLTREGYYQDQTWERHEFTCRDDKWSGRNIWFPIGRRHGRISFTKPHSNYYFDQDVNVKIPRFSHIEEARESLKKLILLAWGTCCANLMDNFRKVNLESTIQPHQWALVKDALYCPSLYATPNGKFSSDIYTALLEEATDLIATRIPNYASLPTTPYETTPESKLREVAKRKVTGDLLRKLVELGRYKQLSEKQAKGFFNPYLYYAFTKNTNPTSIFIIGNATGPYLKASAVGDYGGDSSIELVLDKEVFLTISDGILIHRKGTERCGRIDYSSGIHCEPPYVLHRSSKSCGLDFGLRRVVKDVSRTVSCWWDHDYSGFDKEVTINAATS